MMLVCEDCGHEITDEILGKDEDATAYCSFCDEWVNVVDGKIKE